MTERPTHETPESSSSDLDQEPIGGPGSALFRLGLATFGVLALELATIRWMSGQIRIFAYFNNLVLIATFLGMGLGVAIGRRRPELFHRVFPAPRELPVLRGGASVGLESPGAARTLGCLVLSARE